MQSSRLISINQGDHLKKPALGNALMEAVKKQTPAKTNLAAKAAKQI
jgi:hypothetical protein